MGVLVLVGEGIRGVVGGTVGGGVVVVVEEVGRGNSSSSRRVGRGAGLGLIRRRRRRWRRGRRGLLRGKGDFLMDSAMNQDLASLGLILSSHLRPGLPQVLHPVLFLPYPLFPLKYPSFEAHHGGTYGAVDREWRIEKK